MARVLVLTGDLLFGSRVQGQLQGAGEEVELLTDGARLRARLAEGAPSVLVVDLTADPGAAIELVGALGPLERPPTLGFYSHVEADVRARAERAGFELVVARSRMAREGAALVAGLAAPPASG